MHYFLDGYNLLFRTIHGQGDEELRVQRERIIEALAKQLKIAKIHATLVFDSQFHPGPAERLILRQLDVHFTDSGQTADDYILEALSRASNPKEQTVVTSDQKLAWASRRKGAESLTVEDFLPMLKRIYLKKLRQVPRQEEKAPVIPKKKSQTLDEHYEHLFKERLQNEAPSLLKENVPQEKKKLKKQKLEKVEETDLERWERAFNRDV